MQQKKLNVILFDDSSYEASKINNPSKKLNEDISTITPNQLSAELKNMNKKIQQIESLDQNLKLRIQEFCKKIQNNGQNQVQDTKRQVMNKEQILNLMQKKILILIQETQKIVEQLKQEVEKIITKQIMNRKLAIIQNKQYKQNIEKKFEQKIRQMQVKYNQQINNIKKKNQNLQNKFEQKLQSIEKKVFNKIKEYQKNQIKYKQRIKQLQNQINNKIKNQKVVTNENNQNNLNNITSRSQNKINQIQDGEKQNSNCSRVRRKKIFEKKNNESHSVSPIRTIYSELNSVRIFNKQLDQFQDFKQNELDGSDEDVFFYPSNQKEKIPNNLINPTNVNFTNLQKNIFSPFDLN